MPTARHDPNAASRRPFAPMPPWWLAALLLAVALPAVAAPGASVSGDAQSRLQAMYQQQADRLHGGPFDLPLQIESSQQSGQLEGDIHAVLEHPLEQVQQLLSQADGWCDVLVLVPNIRACSGQGGSLQVRAARRFDQSLDDTRQIEFDLQVPAAGPDLLQARIEADEGPLGTSDYRIMVEAVAVDEGRTFMHLSYGYEYGFGARMAARMYLSTKGSDKVGFSVVGRDNGEPEYVDGLRGAVERNAMRLYLAIDSRLATADVPPDQRHEASLRRWLEAIAEYPRQLAEDEPDAYFAAKSERFSERQLVEAWTGD